MSNFPLRILLIEDSEHDRRAFRRAFQKGHTPVEITECDRAEQALERLAAETASFDVVVTDHKLPGLTGLELCQELIRRECPLPLVLMTGAGTEHLAVEALKAGVYDYVVKDFDQGYLELLPVALPDVVQKHSDRLARRRAEAALAEERALLAQRVEERTAELRRANLELAQASRVKDEFLAAMSHELRTPLNGILNLSGALSEGVYGPLTEKQLQSLRTIEDSSRRLTTLLNDILDLSRGMAGKLALQIESTQVEPVCQLCLKRISPAAQKKHQTVSMMLDDAVQTAQADERRLAQMLDRLLNNAVKFTPEGGAIGLEVAGDAAQRVARFTVWDAGIGVAPENLGRLFQPFVQLDAKLSRQYGGAGLGLALVKQLAELHGGSVSVESDGVPGHGSRFTVTLPTPGEENMG